MLGGFCSIRERYKTSAERTQPAAARPPSTTLSSSDEAWGRQEEQRRGFGIHSNTFFPPESNEVETGAKVERGSATAFAIANGNRRREDVYSKPAASRLSEWHPTSAGSVGLLEVRWKAKVYIPRSANAVVRRKEMAEGTLGFVPIGRANRYKSLHPLMNETNCRLRGRDSLAFRRTSRKIHTCVTQMYWVTREAFLTRSIANRAVTVFENVQLFSGC